jgi:two-component system LytT family response regulator
MITCVIIDDDLLARESLSNLIESNFKDELILVGVAATAKVGLNLIRQKSPQLIFLNIELPDESGFSILNHFPIQQFETIFTTSSTEHAIPAIKHMAVDYLLKPISLIDLKASVIRYERKTQTHEHSNNLAKQLIRNFKMGVPYHEKIALPTYDGFQVIRLNEILYCQASENYSYINTISNETLLITKTLKNLEELLPSDNFFRIHKSVLLNINYVKCFSRREGFMVTLDTGLKFEIATRRQEEFINLFLRKHSEIKQDNEFPILIDKR